jgi:hypothetical protein
MLVVGLWSLAFGRWPLVVGLWSLAFGRWPLVVGLSPQDSVSIFFACFAMRQPKANSMINAFGHRAISFCCASSHSCPVFRLRNNSSEKQFFPNSSGSMIRV